MLEPTPELPDETLISDIEFPTRIRTVLAAAGLETVGEVRETSDEILLSFQDLGKASIAYLRESLGLPSTDEARALGKKPARFTDLTIPLARSGAGRLELNYCPRPALRLDGFGIEDEIHAAYVTALDLDDGGGSGARGYQLSRHAACGGEAGYCAAELGLTAKPKA